MPPRMIMVVLLSVLLALSPGVAVAQRHADQRSAFQQHRAGRILSLPEIEKRVVPTMKGAQYIGMEFDGETSVYTLKFLRGGKVIWVDVDGRSGAVLGRTGR